MRTELKSQVVSVLGTLTLVFAVLSTYDFARDAGAERVAARALAISLALGVATVAVQVFVVGASARRGESRSRNGLDLVVPTSVFAVTVNEPSPPSPSPQEPEPLEASSRPVEWTDLQGAFETPVGRNDDVSVETPTEAEPPAPTQEAGETPTSSEEPALAGLEAEVRRWQEEYRREHQRAERLWAVYHHALGQIASLEHGLALAGLGSGDGGAAEESEVGAFEPLPSARATDRLARAPLPEEEWGDSATVTMERFH